MRNVNEMYQELCKVLVWEGVQEPSRNGQVLTILYPVIVEVEKPWERVLFDTKRDCNHFFHLFEAIWMLAGQNDVEFVSQFNPRMKEFSDDGKSFHGAYGFRWFHHFGIDQVHNVIAMLEDNPQDRRAVLTMWDPHSDLGKDGRDVPCNQQMFFRVVAGRLNMTTTNRSNDLVWGLCGANAVHLSLLHEYIAVSLGLPVGHWIHMSNNLHVYERHWDLIRFPETTNWYPEVEPTIVDPSNFLADCHAFVEYKGEGAYLTKFFQNTVITMLHAWDWYKAGNIPAAIAVADHIEASDWRKACVEWLERRNEQS